MKKQNAIVSIALAAVLLTVPTLSGCSGESFKSVDFAPQDTSYAVTSQGGSAVSYGNYVYFINGTRGYDDTNGSNNVWDEAVKGGVYRAELMGEKITGDYSTFKPKADDDGYEFKHTSGTDYFDDPLEVVDVTKIAAKTVGTTGYANGGIFIYDNYMYFASPNNKKNSAGTVQTTRTDFFMMPLGGGSPKRIYTTSEGVDTTGSAYAFYKYNGNVYLVVHEGEDIVSVKINVAKAKAEDTKKVDAKATSVYFPVRDTYYNGISTNTVEDFIYFVRAVTDKDSQRAGTVIEAMRPDCSENFVVSMSGRTETIEAVRDGVLFYRTTNNVNETVIAYDSLHDALMEYSPTYAAEQSTKTGDDVNMQISGQFKTNMSSITSSYAFRPDTKSNVVYFIGVSTSTISLYDTKGPVRTLYVGGGTLQFMRGDYVYVAGTNSDFYRIQVWDNNEDFGDAQQLASNITTAGISCDYVNGYFTYFAEVDQWASAYTYFYKVDGVEGAEPIFIGQRASSDIPSDEEIEKIKESQESDD